MNRRSDALPFRFAPAASLKFPGPALLQTASNRLLAAAAFCPNSSILDAAVRWAIPKQILDAGARTFQSAACPELPMVLVNPVGLHLFDVAADWKVRAPANCVWTVDARAFSLSCAFWLLY